MVKERQEHIIRRSTKAFVKKGFSQTNMREICKACEMSAGSVYHYFGSKEEILYAVISSAGSKQAEYLESFASTLDKKEPGRALASLMRKLFEWHNDNQDVTLFTYQETRNLPRDAREQIFESECRIHSVIEGFLIEGAESGEFRVEEPKLVAHDIMMLAHAWAIRRWLLRKYFDFETYLKVHTDMMLKSLQHVGHGKQD